MKKNIKVTNLTAAALASAVLFSVNLGNKAKAATDDATSNHQTKAVTVVKSPVEQAKESVDAAQKDVDSAQKNLDSAKSSADKINAQYSSQKQTFDKLTKSIKDQQEKLNGDQDLFNNKYKVNIGDAKTYKKAIEDSENNKLSESDQEYLDQKLNARHDKYNKDYNQETKIRDINNLSTDNIRQISAYAVGLINSVREKLGKSDLRVNDGSVAFAKDFQQYLNQSGSKTNLDDWDKLTGAMSKASSDNGLKINDDNAFSNSFDEATYLAAISNMDDLENGVRYLIISTAFNKPDDRYKELFENSGNLYFSVVTSSTDMKSTSFHFFVFANDDIQDKNKFSLANPTVMSSDEKYFKKNADELQTSINNSKNELDSAKEKLDNIGKQQVQANYLVKSLQATLNKAQAKLNQAQIAYDTLVNPVVYNDNSVDSSTAADKSQEKKNTKTNTSSQKGKEKKNISKVAQVSNENNSSAVKTIKTSRLTIVYNRAGKKVGFIRKGKTLKALHRGKTVTIKGLKYYQIGKNKFVKAANVRRIVKNKQFYKGQVKGNKHLRIRVYGSNGKFAKKYVYGSKTYKFSQKKTIKGQVYYKIAGKNLWVRAKDLKLIK